jgi:hypothetical protein
MTTRRPLLLHGAIVQRVDVGPEALVLRVRAPGETRFVVVAAGRKGKGAAVGITEHKPWRGGGLPGGSAPEGEKVRLRARLEGARVEALGPRWIALGKGEAHLVVEAGERITVREAAPAEAIGADAADAAAAEEEPAWIEAGARLARELGDGVIRGRQDELSRALRRASERVGRRVEAIGGDLARIAATEGTAARASLFVAEAARAPRGAHALSVTDWSDGEPRVVEMALDPARPAREQVDAVFKRARRLKQGAAVAAQRLRDAEQARARLDAVRARVAEAATPEALEALVVEARAAAPRDFALAAAGSAVGAEGTRKRGAEPARPYRLYRGAGGERILVGRGAAHNDALTFKVARPHDLWLHAKSLPGAHVVVPLDRGCTCPSELLIDAAHLAAHFSDARGEGSVEVQHTPRRYLRKPRGAAPGVVVVDREKVTVLRVDPERVTRLLAAEEP